MTKYDSNHKAIATGDHRDYGYNLEIAKNFITKLAGKLPPGMGLRVGDSHGLPQALLWISWTPPRHAPVGNWANPICMHQPHGTFGKSLEKVFNDYVKRVEDFEKKFGQNEAL